MQNGMASLDFGMFQPLSNLDVNNENKKKQDREAEQLNIIDLDDDCIEAIFLKLPREDLANIAESNIRFLEKACYAYGRNYTDTPFESGYDECDLKTFTRLMNIIKHFGTMITKLDLYDAHDDCIYNERITDALFQNCHSNITDICFDRVDQHTLNKIRQPFLNLRNLNIYGLTLPLKIAQLNRWFPNITKLILRCTGMFLEEYCNLKRLIEADISLRTLGNMKIFLRSNPQLINLRLRCNNSQIVDGELFNFMANHLPNLEHLGLTINEWRPVTYLSNAQFNNLRTLSLTLCWDMINDPNDVPTNLGIISNVFEQTTIRGLCMNDGCLQFVSRCRRVTELEFLSYDDIDPIMFIHLANSCPMLKKLQIVFIPDGNNDDFQVDGIIHLIGNCNELISVTLHRVMGFIRSYHEFCHAFEQAKRFRLIDSKWTIKQIIGPFKTIDLEIFK